ncbi:MAG: AMP-binding protein [Candidatus Binatia bacterium]
MTLTHSRLTAAAAGTVLTLLDDAVARVPTRRAVADELRTLDYRTLQRRVAAAAECLRAEGLGRGDRIALELPSSVAFVESFLAILATGAAAMPVPSTARAGELRALFAEADVRALVTAVDDHRHVAALTFSADADGLRRVAGGSASAHQRTADRTPPAPDDVALIATSSGTTARPHLVSRTHANLWWEAQNFSASTEIDSADVVLGVVPLSHAHGLGNAFLAALRAGASLVLRPRFLRRQTLDLLATERVTLFPAVPFMLRMLAATDRRRTWDLSALRLCVSAGAPLPAEIFEAFHARFGVRVRQLYGLTEAGSVTCDLAPDAAVDAATVGRPLGNVVVTIERADGTIAAPGEVGEIVIRSAAAEGGATRPLRTHDLGRADASGALTITGRTSLFINSAGNKVDPAEVEAALRAHPAVADVAVFGLAAAHGDQVVAAAVVLASPVAADVLRAHCHELLAPYKVPRVLRFRDALPRSPLGKVLIGRLLTEA